MLMPKEEGENLIEIRGAYKRYNTNNVILRGLNMTVAKGTIYGLLGPSGCGKTTLLSCVAGYNTLDSGSISVQLTSKKQLGYMPQEIALIELFTVSEMLQYFGKLNGLSSFQVTERGRDLLDLMQLPHDIYLKRVIGSLSGGQQRRISLTVALLHDPLLLILDEPTVGLDPLISHRLWEFFLETTEQDGKTLIITTHYIEEARQAHMIGLMRKGVLLSEASPLKLLTDHKCNALEDVFLLLSEQQLVTHVENEEAYPKKTYQEPLMFDGTLWNRQRLKAQVYKNTCWAKRNIPMLLFMLLLPAFLMYLFCTVYSDTLHGVIIAALSKEVLPRSCFGPDALNEAELPRCKPQSHISCRYLRLIQEKSYVIKEYTDFDSAYQSVVDGTSRAMLHFSQNYSWALIRRLSDGVITPDRYLNTSMVDVYIDRAEMTIGFKIDKDLRESFEDLVKVVYRACGYNVRAGDQLLKFEKPIFGDMDPKFTDSAISGFIIPVVFYFTTYFSASSLGSEKLSGFLERCLIAGVRRTELMFAHMVVQILMVCGQNLMLFSIAYGVYDLPLHGSWGLIIFFVFMSEMQGMFYGFFLGTAFEEERLITYSSVGTVICLFLSCGMFWPIEGAHWIIYLLLRHFPIVMSVESYRAVTMRGWGLQHRFIITTIIANTGLALTFLSMFILVSKIKK